jgi:hypothetical protein
LYTSLRDLRVEEIRQKGRDREAADQAEWQRMFYARPAPKARHGIETRIAPRPGSGGTMEMRDCEQAGAPARVVGN